MLISPKGAPLLTQPQLALSTSDAGREENLPLRGAGGRAEEVEGRCEDGPGARVLSAEPSSVGNLHSTIPRASEGPGQREVGLDALWM